MRFTESVFFKDVRRFCFNFHAAVYPKEGLQKGETTEALGSVIHSVHFCVGPSGLQSGGFQGGHLWTVTPFGVGRLKMSLQRHGSQALSTGCTTCCYYVVLLLCCAVFMKIMKWHYHRLYIYNYIYIHIFQRATVYSGGVPADTPLSSCF